MNIDGYLHRFKAGLARLEELGRKVVDLLTNRVDANLQAIANTVLVDLPADRSFTYDDFISSQLKFQSKVSEQLQIRNTEVQTAIADLLHLVRTYPRENADVAVDEAEAQLFVRHYSRQMYQAILKCMLRSLQAMKKRLGSKTTTGFFFLERPFFDVVRAQSWYCIIIVSC